MPDSDLPVWLLDSPSLFRRPGSPYQSPEGRDWDDNALRFAVFCHAVARVSQTGDGSGWRPQVVHCNDWHSGLVPLLLKRLPAPRPRSVFTIHNAAFQGNFPLALAPRLGIPGELLGPDGIEFYGQLSFLKAGIRYADRITTVSPRYAEEILTPEFGCGMDGLLRARRDALSGVLNGIDTSVWNPRTDPLITRGYSADDRSGKQACKQSLQQQLGLDVDARKPLAIMVNRLTRQKMADTVLDRLPDLLQRHPDLQFAMLGQGERDLEQGFSTLQQAFPGRVSTHIGYNEPEAHRLHAGGDILLHGARFEPCGLTQMYAMRYGTVPVVRRVGGLADTVEDTAGKGATQTGFAFEQDSGEALEKAVDRCIEARVRRPEAWRRLQRRGMDKDFSWQRPAGAYRRLYHRLIDETQAVVKSATRALPL